ncbi:thiS family protein [Asticcacaulis biprosthecium C19]|uniref:ThiS family protein n=1 Tax=Asticcacaulis biprosthecium C19 TaxID=715226 RepID=F4QL22_9CAUL|nr:MoaD/ThiS family protein [Asticcacaulis biprosthecium]EGF93397.1 thiS family protein [Asticcacaulis biprosthecium C19]
MAKVEVLFFGRMADVAGARRKTCDAVRLLTLRESFFGADVAAVRMSVNQVQVFADQALNDGDEVAFFSVFSGG